MFGKVVVLLGPTAVGKSRLSLELAERFQVAIIAADSRQVYRYMDIGTAKPAAVERARAPHYMIDLVEPDDTYSAARFREEGRRVLQRSAVVDRIALVAGGTGFYVRALLDEPAMPAVAPDPGRREAYHAEAEEAGGHALHGRLAALDPSSARRIHPNNLPRVMRALEIVETLGGPVPVSEPEEGIRALYLGLTRERSRLIEIADRRVLQQVDAGLVEETRLLLEMGYNPASPSLSGFPYRQMIGYLEGRLTLAEAVREYQIATHRFIRRQMTWFRAESRILWIDAAADPVTQAARAIEEWIARDASAGAPSSSVGV